MQTLKEQIVKFVRQESATTFLEYSLLVVVIAMVVVVAATTFGNAVMQMLQNAANAN